MENKYRLYKGSYVVFISLDLKSLLHNILGQIQMGSQVQSGPLSLGEMPSSNHLSWQGMNSCNCLYGTLHLPHLKRRKQKKTNIDVLCVSTFSTLTIFMGFVTLVPDGSIDCHIEERVDHCIPQNGTLHHRTVSL